MDREILILGSSPAALQAARDLADCGFQVTVVEQEPYLGQRSLPTRETYLERSRLLETIRHPRIQARTTAGIDHLVQGERGEWTATLRQQPRFVDLASCTGCGECVQVCPVTLPGTDQKAIRLGGEPNCAVITKQGISPCSRACPAGIHVQGYVALTAAGRYREAYNLIHEALPFPSVCGRVCNHYCEESCSRTDFDQAVNIMALKRFVTDRVYQEQDQEAVRAALASGGTERRQAGPGIAVIGAGPAGLTAARDLVRAGYSVTVFDANSQAGGMMRVGIPPHRLDYDQLAWEVEQILLEGVDLQLNTWVDDIPGLLENGFKAVLLATGAHRAVKVGIENADHPDNWLSLDFLKKVCLGETIDLRGRNVIVLGGGDVAMDAARSAIRLGEPRVRIVCRGLRASFNEIAEAEEEGIEIIRGRVFQRIVLEKGRIAGVQCLEAEVGEVIDGKRQFQVIRDSEHLIPGDLVIWAVGQRPDFTFLPPDDAIVRHSSQGIQADERMMTSLEGVFTAGDVRRGTTFFVVDAVGEGHRAARAILDYLEGGSSREPAGDRHESRLEREEIERRIQLEPEAGRERASVPCIPVEDRRSSFSEVELTLTEAAALQEAGRCLICGPCSECLACLEACGTGAILHEQLPQDIPGSYCEVLVDPSRVLAQELPGTISIEGEGVLAGSAAAYQVIRKHGAVHHHRAPGRFPVSLREEGLGLLLCQCGGRISGPVDTAKLSEEALDWPGVALAQEVPYACTAEGKQQVQRAVQDHGLSRIILAACSCCELDQVCYSCTFQRVRCKGNLGEFSGSAGAAQTLFVNIREACADVHPRSRSKATAAARKLIRSTLARRAAGKGGGWEPPLAPPRVLVIGEGPAAAVCLRSLEALGLEREFLQVLSGEVLRSGGRYTTGIDGGKAQGDVLVLAPASGAELDFLIRSLVRVDQEPLVPIMNRDRAAGDLGLMICPPEDAPDLTGRAAAAQAAVWGCRQGPLSGSPPVRVDPFRCRGCGTCLEVCGFGIPALVPDHGGSRAEINPYLCLGCGTCAAHCPSGAISPGVLTDRELIEMLDEVLG